MPWVPSANDSLPADLYLFWQDQTGHGRLNGPGKGKGRENGCVLLPPGPIIEFMPDLVYLSLWLRGFEEQTMLGFWRQAIEDPSAEK